jgi:hypothetical protein
MGRRDSRHSSRRWAAERQRRHKTSSPQRLQPAPSRQRRRRSTTLAFRRRTGARTGLDECRRLGRAHSAGQAASCWLVAAARLSNSSWRARTPDHTDGPLFFAPHLRARVCEPADGGTSVAVGPVACRPANSQSSLDNTHARPSLAAESAASAPDEIKITPAGNCPAQLFRRAFRCARALNGFLPAAWPGSCTRAADLHLAPDIKRGRPES